MSARPLRSARRCLPLVTRNGKEAVKLALEKRWSQKMNQSLWFKFVMYLERCFSNLYFLRWERGDRKGLLHEVVSELRTEQVCILRA